MNEQSVTESNAILAAAASRVQIGDRIPGSPADLAGEAGIDNRLAAARAIRALLSRGRISQDAGGYRLLDVRPLELGEKASVRRPMRPRRSAVKAVQSEADEVPTYERLGRVIVERLIESSAEVAELRTALERARAEAESARREAVEISRAASADTRHADQMQDEVASLKKQLEMTEANLRTVVQAAKSRPASPLDDGDAKAILDILSSKEQTEQR